MSKTVLRDIGNALTGLFGGGQLEPDRRMTLEVLFGLLGYLAKLDSLITSHEAEFINALMDRLQLSMREREVASTALARGRARDMDIVTEINRYRAVHEPGAPETELLYSSLIKLAAADERLRPKERQFLETLTEELGYREEELERRLQAFDLIQAAKKSSS